MNSYRKHTPLFLLNVLITILFVAGCKSNNANTSTQPVDIRTICDILIDPPPYISNTPSSLFKRCSLIQVIGFDEDESPFYIFRCPDASNFCVFPLEYSNSACKACTESSFDRIRTIKATFNSIICFEEIAISQNNIGDYLNELRRFVTVFPFYDSQNETIKFNSLYNNIAQKFADQYYTFLFADQRYSIEFLTYVYPFDGVVWSFTIDSTGKIYSADRHYYEGLFSICKKKW